MMSLMKSEDLAVAVAGDGAGAGEFIVKPFSYLWAVSYFTPDF